MLGKLWAVWQHALDDANKAMECANGITAKALFQRVQAELKLEDAKSAAETMAFARRLCLGKEVEDCIWALIRAKFWKGDATKHFSVEKRVFQ